MRPIERYMLEQEVLPGGLFDESGKALLVALLQKRGAFMITLLNEIGKENGYRCPYREDQFVFKPQLVRGHGDIPEFAMLMIEMPEPEMEMLCSRLIICHDKKLEHIGYYTVEKSFFDGCMLCGVNKEGSHVNYGDAPEDEFELFKAVHGLYVRELVRKTES